MTGSTGTTGVEFRLQPPIRASVRTAQYENLIRAGPVLVQDAVARDLVRFRLIANDRAIGSVTFRAARPSLGFATAALAGFRWSPRHCARLSARAWWRGRGRASHRGR